MEGISITTMSSKGQVVIPLGMRGNMQEGESLIVIKNNNQIILKKASDFSENVKEDLEFARRTEEAFRRVDNGEFVKANSENLFEEMDKW